jgi:uncharacterized cupredoxin-like copper-binding protein
MKNNYQSIKAYWIPVLVVMLFALSGCGAATDTPSAGETPGAGTGETVQVTLSEFQITMPATLTAGPITFEVTNAGTFQHGLNIEGQGIEAELEQNLEPGETGILEVDLPAGTYEVYCPVGNHRSEGMELELTVSAP